MKINTKTPIFHGLYFESYEAVRELNIDPSGFEVVREDEDEREETDG